MTLLQLVVLNACHLGPSAMISDLNLLLFYDDTCCLWSYLQLLSGTRGPKVTEIGITGGDGYDVRITCVHRVLMLCSGTLLKGVP
jgi:hypothetical protein